MYRATDDTRYLDKFVQHAEAVLARTDQARGVTEYRGRSLPAWRVGGSYTFAVAYLPDGRGRNIIRVLADCNNYNDVTRVIVASSPRRGTFALGVRNARLKKSEVHRNLSMDPRSVDYYVRRVNRASDLVRVGPIKQGGRFPATIPRPTRYSVGTQSLSMVLGLHTALITYPFAQFARMVRGNPALAGTYGANADRFAVAAASAMAVHDEDWNDLGDYGTYVFRRGSPIWADGVELPHNQYAALGRTFYELYAATGVEAYRERADKLTRLLKQHLRLDVSGAYVWDYWWGKGYTGWSAADSPSYNTPAYRGYRAPEDISHGAVSSDFAGLASIRSRSMDATDQIRFANTFHANMTRPDGELAWSVTGDGLAGSWDIVAGEWLGAALVSKDVFRTTERTLAEHVTDGVGTPRLLYAVARAVETSRILEADPRPLSAPRVVTIGTIPGPRLAGDFTMTADVLDEPKPPVYFFLDRSMVSSSLGPPYQQVWRTSWLPDGPHVFGAVAFDADGRSHVARVQTFVDNTRPLVVTRSASPRVLSPDGDGFADWIVFDMNSSEEAQSRITLREARTGTWVVPAYSNVRLPKGRRRWSWNGLSLRGTPASEGWYRLVVEATDGAGNASRSITYGFGLNKTVCALATRAYVTRRATRIRIAYTLRRKAKVWVTILDRRSRTVRRLVPGSSQRPGRHVALWDCRDGRAKPVRRGAYRVIVRSSNWLGSMSIPAWVQVR
jgi:flagellar hook assembly protein FlgD